jgi:hypothetical protein
MPVKYGNLTELPYLLKSSFEKVVIVAVQSFGKINVGRFI